MVSLETDASWHIHVRYLYSFLPAPLYGLIQSSQFHFGVARARGCSATPSLFLESFIRGNSKNTQWGKRRPRKALELCAPANGNGGQEKKANHNLQNFS